MWHPFQRILLLALYILILPLLLILLFLLFLYKQAICLIAKLFQDVVGPLPSSNCLHLADEIWSKPHLTVISGVEFEGRTSLEELATNVFEKAYNMRDEKGQRCYRELGYHPVHFLGHGFWKRVSNFKINRIHVWGETPIYEKDLSDVVEKLMRQPFGREEPLWSAHLVQNYNGDPNRTFIFFRFHHLLADGMSIVKFLYALTGSYQLPYSFPKPSRSIKSWRHFKENSGLSKILSVLSLITVDIVEFFMAIFPQDKHSLLFNEKGQLKMTGEWICSTGRGVAVERLKKASKHYKCAIGHLIMAGVSNGLARYCDKYHRSAQFPKGFHFLSAVPVPGHPNLRLVNHWCLAKIHARMSSEQASDKLEYFKEETMRSVSGSSVPTASAFLFQYICGLLPRPVIGLFTARGSYTVIFSNVVGPQEGDRMMDSLKLSGAMFWMPIQQEATALGIGVISCNGNVRLCLTADLGCIPSRHRLQDLTTMIYEEMLDISNVDIS